MVFDDAGFQQKIEMTRGVLTPFMDDLAKFGPDGELINSIASGTLTIASSIATIGEAGEFSAEKMQAVGDVIGSIAGIMAANGKSQIAEIDRQIAAEKKRDGKSKESLAKIKNMEKEKEKIARKNFEMNKKMQIAQTIANTAAGVMKTMGDTGFFGAPLAMAVAAMGAAQVALIQKQTFQGGGGSPDAAAKPASPLASTVKTCPSVGVPPLSLRIKSMPGILNLSILASPIVTSFDTVAELAAASCPIRILFEPVVRSFVPELPASVPTKVLSLPVVISLPACLPIVALPLPVVFA